MLNVYQRHLLETPTVYQQHTRLLLTLSSCLSSLLRLNSRLGRGWDGVVAARLRPLPHKISRRNLSSIGDAAAARLPVASDTVSEARREVSLVTAQF